MRAAGCQGHVVIGRHGFTRKFRSLCDRRERSSKRTKKFAREIGDAEIILLDTLTRDGKCSKPHEETGRGKKWLKRNVLAPTFDLAHPSNRFTSVSNIGNKKKRSACSFFRLLRGIALNVDCKPINTLATTVCLGNFPHGSLYTDTDCICFYAIVWNRLGLFMQDKTVAVTHTWLW